MINADSRLFCSLDGLLFEDREQRRSQAIANLGLSQPGSIPIFDEATQTAAHFLEIPVCVLGLIAFKDEHFKASVGLSRLGFMNELATTRQLPRLESFCTHVVDSQQPLIIYDTFTHPAFANSALTHQYGVRAYLGVPLLTSTGNCIGTLAVMDLMPRNFTNRDIEFLQMTARWSMSELERQVAVNVSSTAGLDNGMAFSNNIGLATQLRVDLLTQLTQELRTPLTSVMGMASVLIREIYGPLTNKQKEYLDIIHQSGQYLLSLVNEILELSALKGATDELKLTSIDIEMLCQQAINTLEQAAHRREQQIRLSVEPGRRVWLLDKNKVRQMLYHLLFALLLSSTAGSILRLHVSRKTGHLNIAVWVSHPWLGEGLAHTEAYSQSALVSAGVGGTVNDADDQAYLAEFELNGLTTASTTPTATDAEDREHSSNEYSTLGIKLCRILAEMHGGQLIIHTTSESGSRYVVSLPQD